MSTKVYPYKMGSKSGKAIANALGVKRVRLQGSKLRPDRHTYINWGSPREPEVTPLRWLNTPDAVDTCSNKHNFYEWCSGWDVGECIPEYTPLKDVALRWEAPVIARAMLRANGGRGAYYLTHEELLEDNSNYLLFTKYFKKKEEYRVHFGPNGIFHVQQKRKRLNEEADFKIRNHAAGWVFTIHDVNPPDCVMDVCRSVMDILPLDFGAFDVLYNHHLGQAKITEVNTAPAIEGTTLEKYVDMFRSVL